MIEIARKTWQRIIQRTAIEVNRNGRCNKPWTDRELELLRDGYGKMPVAELAARIGRTRIATKLRARLEKLAFPKRIFTKEEDQIIIAGYHKRPAQAIADQLNVKLIAIFRRAAKLGIARKIKPMGDVFIAFISEHHAAGECDNCIAKAYGCERHTVGDYRKRLGLAINGATNCHLTKAVIRGNTATQLTKAGLPNIGYLRVAAFKKYAIDNGWHEDLGPRHVQTLNALARLGPSTKSEVCQEIGVKIHERSANTLTSNGGRGSVMADLVWRKLVVNLGRLRGGRGQGANLCVYSLSPLALEMRHAFIVSKETNASDCPRTSEHERLGHALAGSSV